MGKKENDIWGMGIPGGLLIGIGVGLWLGHIAAFTLIGLGVGFIVAMIASRNQ